MKLSFKKDKESKDKRLSKELVQKKEKKERAKKEKKDKAETKEKKPIESKRDSVVSRPSSNYKKQQEEIEELKKKRDILNSLYEQSGEEEEHQEDTKTEDSQETKQSHEPETVVPIKKWTKESVKAYLNYTDSNQSTQLIPEDFDPPKKWKDVEEKEERFDWEIVLGILDNAKLVDPGQENKDTVFFEESTQLHKKLKGQERKANLFAKSHVSEIAKNYLQDSDRKWFTDPLEIRFISHCRF